MLSSSPRIALVVLIAAAAARADTVLPAPGTDAALDARAVQWDKQARVFNQAPFGIGLDLAVADVLDRAAVTAFLADASATDFTAFTTAAGRARTPREVATSYSGHGGMGAFGGAGAAADAYRLLALRAAGAPQEEITAARAQVVRALDALHVAFEITGFPGGPARGIGRPDDIGPVALVPQAASCGNAWERGDQWRAAVNPAYSDWIFRDNISKDQLLGATLGMQAMWDAIATDPQVDAATKVRLQQDALALAHALMEEVDVAGGTLDLVIRDANGCLSEHHDLNPREITRGDGEPIILAEDSSQRVGFNALASLAVMRTLYHVTGDEDVGAFYYEQLVAARGYPALLTTGIARLKSILQDSTLLNLVTNFSNVNMAWQALHQLLRVETDDTLRATYRAAMMDELFDNERSHAAKRLPQAYFHVVRAGFGGQSEETATVARAQLAAWPAPLWDLPYENCDAAEVQSQSCIALDGTPLQISDVASWGGDVVATTAVPIAVRPLSNYEWRSDPRRVNGVGSDRLGMGSDVRLAYWMGRLMMKSADVDANVSAVAIPYPPPPPGPDAGFATDAGVVAATDGGPGSVDAGPRTDGGASAGDAGAVVDGDAGAVVGGDEDAGVLPGDDDAGTSDGAEDGGCGGCAGTGGAWWGIAALLLIRRSRRALRR